MLFVLMSSRILLCLSIVCCFLIVKRCLSLKHPQRSFKQKILCLFTFPPLFMCALFSTWPDHNYPCCLITVPIFLLSATYMKVCKSTRLSLFFLYLINELVSVCYTLQSISATFLSKTVLTFIFFSTAASKFSMGFCLYSDSLIMSLV